MRLRLSENALRVKSATLQDAFWLGRSLRPEDEAEVRASSKLEPSLVLALGLAQAQTYVAIHGPTGDRLCMWGVIPCADGNALAWMLGSIHLEKHLFSFMRYGKKIFLQYLDQHPVLWNWVDSRNVLHLKWLMWCGAKFTDTKMVGDAPFIRFEIRRPEYVRPGKHNLSSGINSHNSG